MKRIIVLGGGYAGVTAANRLASSPQAADLHILLVNPRDTFIERIRLHQVIAGTYEQADRPLADVLHTDVETVFETVALVQPDTNTLLLESGAALSYDFLIYAPGSGANVAPEGAYSVTNWESASTAAGELHALAPGGRVAVVGGGFTAIETAGEIAAERPGLSVALVSQSNIASMLPHRSRRRIRRSLEKLGVSVREHHSVPREADPSAALEADMVLWCTGVAVSDVARRSGLVTDATGRLVVDSTLRTREYRNIVGAGDSAVIDESEYAYQRQSCATAMPMGGHAADVVLAALQQEEPSPHSHGFLIQCVSIGRHDGLIQTVRRNDRPRALTIGGRLGAYIKETVCRTTVKWLRDERQHHHGFSWPKGPKQTN